jgi:hypothetical protein
MLTYADVLCVQYRFGVLPDHFLLHWTHALAEWADDKKRNAHMGVCGCGCGWVGGWGWEGGGGCMYMYMHKVVVYEVLSIIALSIETPRVHQALSY